MKKIICVILCLCFATAALAACGDSVSESSAAPSEAVSETESSVEPEPEKLVFTISDDDLYDRVYGSWLGQAAGVEWGASKEFWFQGVIEPESDVPQISSLNLANTLGQDDLYVEIPYMDAMKAKGVDCSLKVVAEAFKDTTFGLDHANKKGRENLRAGIDAPDSGSYLYNYHCDDIDWQIESDFLGSIYPALVNEGAERAFELGHITNYGDGCYGGVFVVAMHSAAFYAKSVSEIIDAGISVIPEGTKFREVLDDVMSWYKEGLTWEETWQKLQDKWDGTKRCLVNAGAAFNIDAKMNSAYILIGMLYGEGDFDESMKIAMRCGQDSDCNPSSVGAVLGTFFGYKAIDDKWKATLPTTGTFAGTDYSFTDVVKMNYDLAVSLLESKGFKHENGVWAIEYDKDYKPVELEQWPDMPTAELSVTADGGNVVGLAVKYHDINGIASVVVDMGDGTVYKSGTSAHIYEKTGTYTVKCTVTNVNGAAVTCEKEVVVEKVGTLYDDPDAGTYRNIAKIGYAICSVYAPTGSGNKDINIISDGVKTGGNTSQYDTYAGYLGAVDEHVGYLFTQTVTVDKLVFTEGMHFNNGGWFVGETLVIEALVDGEWKNVAYTCDPAYPTGNAQSAYGANFETYTFTFDAVSCKGVRLRGTAGGDAGFIGIAELELYGKEG